MEEDVVMLKFLGSKSVAVEFIVDLPKQMHSNRYFRFLA